MTATSGFIAGGLVHVNRVDRAEPFCPCHDDPWDLCPKWESWGVTAEERAEAQRLAAEVDERWRRQRAERDAVTDPGGCAVCGVPAREHCQRWHGSLFRSEGYVAPSVAVRKARILARRNVRLGLPAWALFSPVSTSPKDRYPMTNAIPEPPNGTIVAWFDKNNDPWVVLHRDDDATNENGFGTELRWWFPVYDQTEDPQAWDELCTDMDGFRGPVVLVPSDVAVSE